MTDLPLVLLDKDTGFADFGCYGSPVSGDSVYDASGVKHSVLCDVVPLNSAFASTGVKQARYSNSTAKTGTHISCPFGVYAVTNLRIEAVNGVNVLRATWFVNNGPANVPAGGTPNASNPMDGYLVVPNLPGPAVFGGSGGGTFDPKPILDHLTTLDSQVAEQFRRLGVDDTKFATDEAALATIVAGEASEGTPQPPPVPSGPNTLITAPGYEGGLVLRNVTPDKVTLTSSS